MFNATATPDSCCKAGHVKGCGADTQAAKFQEGCYGKFKDFFVDNIAIVGGRFPFNTPVQKKRKNLKKYRLKLDI